MWSNRYYPKLTQLQSHPFQRVVLGHFSFLSTYRQFECSIISLSWCRCSQAPRPTVDRGTWPMQVMRAVVDTYGYLESLLPLLHRTPQLICAMHYPLYTLYTVYSYALCTIHYALCTIHYALWTMHCALCTMHFEPHSPTDMHFHLRDAASFGRRQLLTPSRMDNCLTGAKGSDRLAPHHLGFRCRGTWKPTWSTWKKYFISTTALTMEDAAFFAVIWLARGASCSISLKVFCISCLCNLYDHLAVW